MSTFFPLPDTYAVAEIDVEKTLRPLNDPIASAEGARLKTTKCIIYLAVVLHLPFPDNESFKYNAHLIGPGLRPADPDLCITPDMCVPILPETYHPCGRKPLESEPPFPFQNCYHWFGPDMVLDLRVWNDGTTYAEEGQTVLPGVQYYDMDCYRGRDMSRWIAAQIQRERAAKAGGELPAASSQAERSDGHTAVAEEEHPSATKAQTPPQKRAEANRDQVDCDKRAESPTVSRPGSSIGQSAPGTRERHAESLCSSIWDSESSASYMGEPAERSVVPIADMDIFGIDQDDPDALLPVVKVWLDIGAHFKQEDIPSPVDFMRQRDELVRIIGESRARTKARTNMKRPHKPSTDLGDGEWSARPKAGRRSQSKGFWAKLADASSAVLCMRGGTTQFQEETISP